MKGKLKVNTEQRRDLKALTRIGPPALKAAAEALRAARQPLLRAKQLRQVIASALGEDETSCTTLARQLVGLNDLQRQYDLNPSDVVGLLDAALHEESERKEWNDDEIAAWTRVREPLAKLLALENVMLVAKAMDLAYEYTNIYERSKIIADLRPVFDSDGTKVLGMLTCFTLQLAFESRDGDHELGIALDETDIQHLKAECERAIKKSAALRVSVLDPSIPITIVGATDDNGD